jgi:hypothetical protein
MQGASRCEVGGFSSFESAPSIVDASRKLSWEINSGAVLTSKTQNVATATIGSAPSYLGKALP